MSEKPEKVWLVLGHHPPKKQKKYAYTTDPRYYELPGVKPMTDDEYRASADRVKVLTKNNDAIDFIYECGLETSAVVGFLLVDGKYEKDSKITDEVLDIDW